MADVTQVQQTVRYVDGARVEVFQAGEAIIEGNQFYLHTDNKVYKTNTTTALKAAAVGMALIEADLDGHLVGAVSGPINIGGTLVLGVMYGVSDNDGKFRPLSDNGSGDFVTPVGIASSTTVLQYDPTPSGYSIA